MQSCRHPSVRQQLLAPFGLALQVGTMARRTLLCVDLQTLCNPCQIGGIDAKPPCIARFPSIDGRLEISLRLQCNGGGSRRDERSQPGEPPARLAQFFYVGA